MNEKQAEFYNEIKEVSFTLGEWVKDRFEMGWDIARIKSHLKDAAMVAGRE